MSIDQTLYKLLLFIKCVGTFWPPSYKIKLEDNEVFEISSYEKDKENEDEEDEMIHLKDSEIESLKRDEDRYKSLHSHVNNHNRRAIEKRSSNSKLKGKIQDNNWYLMTEEQPFVAGFKHLLDKRKAKLRDTINRSRSKRDEESTSEEFVYDYENFKIEYNEKMEQEIKSNQIFNYSITEEPEEMNSNSLNEKKNCTKEELSRFGIGGMKCLAYDYHHAKDKAGLRRFISRVWLVMKIWIFIYICVAIPCWCQKGWCCCCFRCKFCFPREIISLAKHYYGTEPPGVMTIKGQQLPFKYDPSELELDAFETFETVLRNL